MSTTLKGQPAFQVGLYEAQRLLGFIWPVLSGALVAYITQRLTEIEPTTTGTVAVLVSIAIKSLQLWIRDNSQKRA